MFDHLRDLELMALEVSENYVTLSRDERKRAIDDAGRAGFDVVYEFGRKTPEGPFELEYVETLVNEVASMGVRHVVIEQSEIDELVRARPDALGALREASWFDHVIIEADPYRFPHQHADLIREFGPDVNLANVTAGRCLRLEGLRRGIGRAVNYEILRDGDD